RIRIVHLTSGSPAVKPNLGHQLALHGKRATQIRLFCVRRWIILETGTMPTGNWISPYRNVLEMTRTRAEFHVLVSVLTKNVEIIAKIEFFRPREVDIKYARAFMARRCPGQRLRDRCKVAVGWRLFAPS